MSTAPVALRSFGHEDLPAIRQTLLDVHAGAYADEKDEPSYQRFPWLVDHWGGQPGFACVVGYDGDEPVGLAYGSPMPDGTEWWREHLAAPPADTSTFAVAELMVVPRWRKTGTAARLHAALVEDRPEALAVLLVDSDRPRVEALYATWGYSRIGERPMPDSPGSAVMLRRLRA
ncbi:GNAT family N-acetyltransferase [Actinomadura terrae]|uniref:GNAT family N-acetyltransferase n=1 Tax=Actinomadura terrae TaxID=604353 RepID=UPI001FA7D235|nr:GNAT family N-acetyltransferase [Actinomadura terrae]